MKKIRIGTRDSRLAMIQAQLVASAVSAYDPSIAIEMVPMKTTGDIILDKTLDKIGGKGLFVKELDRALLNGEVDITVHSMKDMPMQLDERIPILATGKREDPRDVLVLPKGKALDVRLPIGSSSARRNIQLRSLFPDFDIKPVRGNVLTRLEKLDRGEYSALVLAAAGLRRLELAERISEAFDTTRILPANCQGVIAVQGREDFPREWLSVFHSEESYHSTRCERAFVRALDGGCSAPIAAYAELEGARLRLHGLYVVEREFEEYKQAIENGVVLPLEIHRGERSGDIDRAEELGRALAEELKIKANG